MEQTKKNNSISSSLQRYQYVPIFPPKTHQWNGWRIPKKQKSTNEKENVSEPPLKLTKKEPNLKTSETRQEKKYINIEEEKEEEDVKFVKRVEKTPYDAKISKTIFDESADKKESNNNEEEEEITFLKSVEKTYSDAKKSETKFDESPVEKIWNKSSEENIFIKREDEKSCENIGAKTKNPENSKSKKKKDEKSVETRELKSKNHKDKSKIKKNEEEKSPEAADSKIKNVKKNKDKESFKSKKPETKKDDSKPEINSNEKNDTSSPTKIALRRSSRTNVSKNKKPELTEEMLEEINSVLSHKSSDEIIISNFHLDISYSDIKTLSKSNWLNDGIINFYMNLINQRAKNEQNYPRVFAINCFFYGKLKKDGFQGVKLWTKKVDVFSLDLFLVPVHSGAHWALSVIDFQKKSIRFYDSMYRSEKNCPSLLKKYLQEESLDKKEETLDTSDWTEEFVKNIPQQENINDCGVFSCIYAEYLSAGRSLNFSQQDIPYFRKKMVYEILHSELL